MQQSHRTQNWTERWITFIGPVNAYWVRTPNPSGVGAQPAVALSVTQVSMSGWAYSPDAY